MLHPQQSTSTTAAETTHPTHVLQHFHFNSSTAASTSHWPTHDFHVFLFTHCCLRTTNQFLSRSTTPQSFNSIHLSSRHTNIRPPRPGTHSHHTDQAAFAATKRLPTLITTYSMPTIQNRYKSTI